jgi:hypothetical protein
MTTITTIGTIDYRFINRNEIANVKPHVTILQLKDCLSLLTGNITRRGTRKDDLIAELQDFLFPIMNPLIPVTPAALGVNFGPTPPSLSTNGLIVTPGGTPTLILSTADSTLVQSIVKSIKTSGLSWKSGDDDLTKRSFLTTIETAVDPIINNLMSPRTTVVSINMLGQILKQVIEPRHSRIPIAVLHKQVQDGIINAALTYWKEFTYLLMKQGRGDGSNTEIILQQMLRLQYDGAIEDYHFDLRMLAERGEISAKQTWNIFMQSVLNSDRLNAPTLNFLQNMVTQMETKSRTLSTIGGILLGHFDILAVELIQAVDTKHQVVLNVQWPKNTPAALPSPAKRPKYDEVVEDNTLGLMRTATGLCYSFSKDGTCKYGAACRFVHAEGKPLGDLKIKTRLSGPYVPINQQHCRNFLRGVACNMTPCPRLHDPLKKASLVPPPPEGDDICNTFQYGLCPNPNCRFRHVIRLSTAM